MTNHQLRVYDDILGLLPNDENPTPLVKLTHTVPSSPTVYAKLEWYNPFGAVKDRIAANMLLDAEKKGLTNKKKLIEPTSGNTGIALASVANVKGYHLRTMVSQEIPQEKKTVLRFLGSDVVEIPDTLCPDPSSPDGAIGTAKATVARYPKEWHMLNQYENEANVQAHYKTTGPEIWKQTEGKITHFFAALGTCGTITGVGKFLKEKNPDIKIIGIHPQEGHKIPGVRSIKQLKVTKLFRPDEYDGLVEIPNKEAYDLCLRINREESIIAGPSSGMALAGALTVLADQPEAVAVILFPDNIFKYTTFFEENFPEFAKKGSSAEPRAEPSPQEQVLKALVQAARNPNTTIELEAAKLLIDSEHPLLIDVRPPHVYAQGHVPGARNIPLMEIPQRASELPEDRGAEIITICNRGNASISGMLFLNALGYKNVRSLNEGTLGWTQKGYSTE